MLVSLSALLGGFMYLFLKVSGGGAFPPPLSREEEQRLFERVRENGDREAREKLIKHNLRLVAHILKKYYTQDASQEDLMSIGTIGLIKAIDSFDVNNGAKFATYASRCLQNEILMYFRGRKKSGGEISINETIDTDREGNPLTYIDIISTEDTIAEDLDVKIYIEKARKAINTVLNEREREIICKRYGLMGEIPLTQRQIADSLNISRSYVSRIEKAALEKIKGYL